MQNTFARTRSRPSARDDRVSCIQRPSARASKGILHTIQCHGIPAQEGGHAIRAVQ